MKYFSVYISFILSLNAFAKQQILNGNFENWSQSGIALEPDSWFSLNSIAVGYPTYGTTRTTDVYDGQYALKLVSGMVDASPFDAGIDTTAMAGLGITTPQSLIVCVRLSFS